MNSNEKQATPIEGESMDASWGGAAEGSATNRERLQWLRDDKYSMFIHWGLYSHLGGVYKGKTYPGIAEWIMNKSMAGIPVEDYKALAGEFNPARFDAGAIVSLAKDAGMRCIVVTAKHHEGFAMFDSAASNFTITKASPFGRDPMKELADACAAAGLRLGFYYSQFQDWVEPDAGGSPDFNAYFERKALPQIKELLTNYGPISVIWFDTPGTMGKEQSQLLVDLVHKLQPECLVNSRVGNGLGDYSTLGDMEIPTQTPNDGGLYESIDTINNSWAWARHDSNWKSPEAIAQSLVRTIARGCAFMLNIGPKDDGSVPKEAAAALRDVGQLVRQHSETIYKTMPSPYPPLSWGDCTVRGRTLYLHVFEWPQGGTLNLPPLTASIEKAVLMETGEEICFTEKNDRLTLSVPRSRPASLIPVISLTFDSYPRARHQHLVLDAQYPLLLRPEYASTSGVRERKQRWMEGFGEWKSERTLINWNGSDASATWTFDVLEPGTYRIQVQYAANKSAETTEWGIQHKGGELLFKPIDTGMPSIKTSKRAPMRFRTADAGLIHFDQPGRHTLSLHPKGAVPDDTVWISTLTLCVG
jgi:alpha-L-fucosidase